MKRMAIVLVAGILAGCGADAFVVECDDGPYLAADRAPRVEAPEGLDNLNPLNEMPLPSASPQEPWPADGPCLERPPQIIRMN